jgi:hypothetical protein
MTDDLHYVPGDNYLIDDISGFKVRASKARMQWDGLMAAGSRFSPRQPQDLVTGVPDDQTVAIARPRQVNQFTALATFINAPCAAGTNVLNVDSTVGWQVGYKAMVMLDSGVNFTAAVSSIGAGTLQIASPLPGNAGVTFGDPLENTVVGLLSTGQIAPGPG